MFALEISEIIRFFSLFLVILGKFLMTFKKNSCYRFSFFARTIPGLECFQGLYQVTHHCFRVGENSVPAKKQIGVKKAIRKKRFFKFYAKIAADTGFRNVALEQRKITTNNNKSKPFKMLYCSFCHFSSNFGHLSEIFWIIGVTFLFSLLLLQFGRML